ncbi:hypothetical protein [Asticcacaulis sp. AC402]|uniref:hypothetical protein n=1 Tax=Asticcacaulis sp. AC402 TaxID=1282361 RepID=UPI0003C3B4D4|nr:hypothetical protein [Asticcacaulis sp. AC402]ESQ77144.1 hypothetical protein ABAC402_01730 [Asticcacaulis sp. AC402]
MPAPIHLSDLGARIAIIGPSSSGKSTLATALGAHLGCKVVHLDLLAHYPDTQWRPRPKPELVALHDAELADPAWVIEGNYGVAMPQRFARATGVIWLDFDRWGCLWRYVRRCFQPASQRRGTLPGAIERLNWRMVQYILVEAPAKQARYEQMIAQSGRPLLRLESLEALKVFYRSAGI